MKRYYCDECGKELTKDTMHITEIDVNGTRLFGDYCLNCLDKVIVQEIK